MPWLIISVWFHDGRYHGSGEWPPSPARLFQALVAGVARGAKISDSAKGVLQWLESLDAPVIAVPSAYQGRSFKTYVPNNDLDAVGGDPRRIGEIRTPKVTRPRHFNAAIPLLYAWTFEQSAEAGLHAQTVRTMANHLYQLGRGVDMAWAQSEILDENGAAARLHQHSVTLWRPDNGGSGIALACPQRGSLASLAMRFAATRDRFKTAGTGRRTSQLFSQAPKPSFRQVSYNAPSEYLLFEIRRNGAFVPQPPARVVVLTESLRDHAVDRLRNSSWLRGDSTRENLIETIFVGRNSNEADKTRRIRITPLPSIGHRYTEQSIRRILMTVPPDCPIPVNDVEWAFSGLTVGFDKDTGEITQELVPADDESMLDHYGIDAERRYRFWRTVTPAALPERAARRRIDPRRRGEEAKGGAERVREQAAAEQAVRQALRHAGISQPVYSVRVQREAFEAKGERAESFAAGTRFAKERLWHVEVEFAEPVRGPILIGDGRYLGLGLMAPVRRTEGIHSFAIVDGLVNESNHNEIARALHRAVMARAQEKMDKRAALPAFFSGHTADGAPSRSGRHEHLAFVFDAPRMRLLIVAPHILERREAFKDERKHLLTLAAALEGFRELRAGAAGKFALAPCPIGKTDDPLFSSARTWESVTPYRATRHFKVNDSAAALRADIHNECVRSGLPKPDIEIVETYGRAGLGLFGRAKLRFRVAVPGPIVLGRDRHFGGGLFAGVTT